MIYEMRTYDLKPRSVPDFEKGFGEKLPGRLAYSILGGLWHTEVGPLNQVVHIWPYDDLNHRGDVRAKAVADGAWPPNTSQFVDNMQTEILTPAPFMTPLGDRKIGPIYELRIYTYGPGDVAKVFEAWDKAIAEREKYSPLAGCWTTEIGGLNKFIHLWAYKSLDERAQVREATRTSGVWPPPSGVSPLKQENKILIPAECSPMQ
jgi:hypothetical protein